MWEMLGSFPDLSEKLVYLPFYRGGKGFIIISGYISPRQAEDALAPAAAVGGA